MGNQGSALGDEPTTAIAQKNLQHFDHVFKAELHSGRGIFANTFGACKFEKRPITLTCSGSGIELVEDVGIASKRSMSVHYHELQSIAWDHANSQVKMTFGSDENLIIITLQNSVEFEGEMKLRLSATASMHRGMKIPSPMYIGMFAGAHKPKPFQRKRPNLSYIAASKLPTLHEMRNAALDLHRGSYRPCAQGDSRRVQIALQHIYEGHNTFPLINVRGAASVANQFRSGALLLITDDALIFKPRGEHGDLRVDFFYDDIEDWKVVDHDTTRLNDSGIELFLRSGDDVFFGVEFIRDVRHTFEYFWNRYKVDTGNAQEVKLGSTHGRPIVSMQTLSGEVPPASEPPTGQTEVVDQDGIVVRPGGRIAPRRQSVTGSITGAKEPSVVPPENRSVKKHWHKVVLHQGWLLKQGGIGIGNNKAWIKRYFVLYKTSQGHFLVYYSDFTECPLYTSEKNHRNIVDMAKATFIRPGSNKQDNPDTPPYSFDIVTTEREWTLCAESQENVQRWLRVITRAVDEDVAILPDEELVFKVKPKSDPLGVLPATDYSTTLRVSALGVSVRSPDMSNSSSSGMDGAEKEHYFWVYTDFYKWSLVCPGGKYALMVNVFADSSFSRRMEYQFRTKDAHRLATAIEFYIEKFMSIMHIRLELGENARAEIDAGIAGIGSVAAESEEVHAGGAGAASGGLHTVAEEDRDQGYADEIDLLGMDGDEVEPPAAVHASNNHKASAHTSTASAASAFGDDPFGSSDPFAEDDDPVFGSKPKAPPAQAKPAVVEKPKPSAPPAPAPAKPAAMSVLDLFDAVPAAPPAATAASMVAVAASAASASMSADPFGADPFGSDPFGAPSSSSTPAVKTAPPLSAAQTQQHRGWFLGLLASGQGPVYSDGTLQIQAKVEVRGSQARITLHYSNTSPAAITALQVTLDDPAGLLRTKLSPLADSLAGLGSATQTVMAECMKPAAPGPTLRVQYTDTLQGKRDNTLPFPLVVSSFHEPLASWSAADFSQRWGALTQPGQELQQVLRPSYALVPAQIHAALSSTLHFGRIQGLPDASDLVLYGAASLRTGAKSPSGDAISVGCLAKLEMNVPANAIRVTLRTVHPAASVALMETVKSLFL